ARRLRLGIRSRPCPSGWLRPSPPQARRSGNVAIGPERPRMTNRRNLSARLERLSTRFASPVSLSLVALAIVVRWLLDPWLGDTLPLVTLYGAVTAAVWIGGYSQGVVAAIVGYLACDYFFIAPRGVFGFLETSAFVGDLSSQVPSVVLI